MLRVGYLYEKICTIENIREAHKHARKDKLFYKEVKMVDSDPDYYFAQIRDILLNHTYKVGKYIVEVINESGKDRTLMKLPYFPDRIIQWAIILQIETHLARTFTFHTCASLPGRGQDRCIKLTEAYLRDVKATQYCLKIDIHHFYPSIDREILKQKLRRIFKDPELLWLLDLIIDSPPGDRGIPIGSYLSQYLANFYLSDLDHKLKEVYHFKEVVRYMDDMTLYSSSKKRLQFFLHNNLMWLLEKEYHLELKGNYQVFPVDGRGVDFCGYVFYHGYTRLRRRTKERMIERMLELRKKYEDGKMITEHDFGTFNAYQGILSHCNSFHLWEKYMEPVIPAIELYRKTHKMKAYKVHPKFERRIATSLPDDTIYEQMANVYEL